jgi:hypothetical protein
LMGKLTQFSLNLHGDFPSLVASTILHQFVSANQKAICLSPKL